MGYLFFTSNFVCDIVHIIDHTVHILWQDVMIFTREASYGFASVLSAWEEQPHMGLGWIG
jgi:hypothetical protein